jgi:hypothetical protein
VRNLLNLLESREFQLLFEQAKEPEQQIAETFILLEDSESLKKWARNQIGIPTLRELRAFASRYGYPGYSRATRHDLEQFKWCVLFGQRAGTDTKVRDAEGVPPGPGVQPEAGGVQ